MFFGEFTMCGIVGYIGDDDSVPFIQNGLQRLEYRGYDSAGISVIDEHQLKSTKSLGKLEVLQSKLDENPLCGHLGIGHTRWATHGVPSEANSHPHFDDPQEIAVVHNGIIENYQELGSMLRANGVQFRSETDTETIAHLIRHYYEGDLFHAVKRALKDIKGAYALGVVCKNNPDTLVAARHGSPLIVGLGEHENYIASDATAILNYTRKVLYLDDGHVCELKKDSYTVQNLEGQAQDLEVHTVDWDDSQAEKSGYPHFMLKEIHEQPDVIRNTLRGRVSESGEEIILDDLAITDEEIAQCPKILIVACGTAWHAGLVGKRLIESLAKIPVEIDIASEFRYRDLIIPPGTIVIPVTQSGETADTLEAIRIAKSHEATILSIVNVVGSTIARESNGIIYLHAGLEIGVASTKAYTSMITAFVILALYCAQKRNTLSPPEIKRYTEELQALPEKISWCLENHDAVEKSAEDPRYRDAISAFFLGRGYNFPTALEGALKLKEISYIHAEGYSAGEMKHGPIALVTDELPCVCVATDCPTKEKIISNIQEVRARNGIVLTIATQGDTTIEDHSDMVIYVPPCMDALSPILNAIPLQLFAYYISVNRGCDVDQPRNLAKSVTVE
jgi:glucosamine--fructose-6-phosphate aminotransferase (isomerizing)